MGLQTRLYHLWLLVLSLPSLLLNGRKRLLLTEMRGFMRTLPAVMKRPLPQALTELTPLDTTPNAALSEAEIRRLADLAALLERQSPLGLCLRRSLTRFHYLRRHNIPIDIQFGAKFVPTTDERSVTGHAWTTYNGQPYFEEDENWRDFLVMLSWPQ